MFWYSTTFAGRSLVKEYDAEDKSERITSSPNCERGLSIFKTSRLSTFCSIVCVGTTEKARGGIKFVSNRVRTNWAQIDDDSKCTQICLGGSWSSYDPVLSSCCRMPPPASLVSLLISCCHFHTNTHAHKHTTRTRTTIAFHSFATYLSLFYSFWKHSKYIHHAH